MSRKSKQKVKNAGKYRPKASHPWKRALCFGRKVVLLLVCVCHAVAGYCGVGSYDQFGVQIVHNYTTNVYYLSRPTLSGDYTLQQIAPGATVNVYSGGPELTFCIGTDPDLTAAQLSPWLVDSPGPGACSDLILVYDYTAGQDTCELLYNAFDTVHQINGVDPSANVFTMTTGSSPYVWIGAGFALGLVIWGFVWYRRITNVVVQDVL